MAVTSVAVEDL
jgi:hypothetical protein